MARIIMLKRDGDLDAATPQDRAPREAATAAEVIIFPGVRYERWSGDPGIADNAPSPELSAIIDRDWLEI